MGQGRGPEIGGAERIDANATLLISSSFLGAYFMFLPGLSLA